MMMRQKHGSDNGEEVEERILGGGKGNEDL